MRAIERILKGRRGFTLLESMLAFSLLAIFLGATAGMMPMFSSTFVEINAMNRMENIADVLLDVIKIEMNLAHDAKINNNTESSQTAENSGSVFWYRARGYGMYICLNAQRLVIGYEPVVDTEGNHVDLPENISFGDDFYMGAVISDMSFTVVEGNPRLVEFSMTLGYNGYTYTAERIFEIVENITGA